MKKIVIILIFLLVITIVLYLKLYPKSKIYLDDFIEPAQAVEKELKLDIPKYLSKTDYNNNGIADSEDILIGARIDAENKPTYISKYYSGGYPPDNEGVCTDVVWRALRNAGYNLKDLVDEDIANNVDKYPRVEGKPDKNIDFRRVPNLITYFDRHAISLTVELIPNDIENLTKWQGGDIIVFDKPTPHMGIVSDIRNKQGVPYMIHNSSPYTKEADHILYWHDNISKIIRHYRISE